MIRRFPFSLTRSIAVGVALRVALTTLLVCGVLSFFVYQALAAEGRRSVQSTLNTDMAGLVDLYAAEGQLGLIKRIDDRIALMPKSGDMPYYLFCDHAGLSLAGNLRQWPDIDPAVSASGRITLKDGQRLLVQVTQLRGGLRLLVGRSLAAQEASLTATIWMFATAGFTVVFLSFAIGLLSAQDLKRRVQAINTVFKSVQHGQLTERVAQDATGDEIAQLSTNVNQMLERVANLIEAQREVTDNIAHETRTPLMRLDSSLTKALSHSENANAIEELEAARGQINGLLRLYDALLDIASTKARFGDRQGLDMVSLSDVASSLAELYRASAEDSGIDMQNDIAPEIVMRADPMQMSQLMANLLDNAFKYGGEGGRIGFRLLAGPVIIVEDRGRGVPVAEREAVFRRYHRSGDPEVAGHGLGLALVKAIATRHGLTVRIEDVEAGAASPGARFIIAPEGMA